MNYIKINLGGSNVYPYELWRLRQDFPNVSFPQPYESADLGEFGVFPVQPSAQPTCDRRTEKVIETAPVESGSFYLQTWAIQSLTQAEQQEVAQQIQAEVVDATQARLDAFARTRNYDGILSLCTYAASPTPKFAAEGQYGVQARDATWAKLYALLAEVQAGTRPMPSGFADVEQELPALVWPN